MLVAEMHIALSSSGQPSEPVAASSNSGHPSEPVAASSNSGQPSGPEAAQQGKEAKTTASDEDDSEYVKVNDKDEAMITNSQTSATAHTKRKDDDSSELFELDNVLAMSQERKRLERLRDDGP